MRAVIVATAVLVLAGCGGGGGGGKASFSQLADEQSRQLASYGHSLADDVTPISQMPQSGKLNYRGVGALNFNGYDPASSGQSQVLARARITADMTSQRLTGSVTDFRTNPQASGTVTGRIDLKGAVAGNAVGGRSSGTITVRTPSGKRLDADTRGSFNGAFTGKKADGIIILDQGAVSDRQGSSPYTLLITGKR